jgi:hypothetical protein
MSEHDTDGPLDTPPTDFHHTIYESLDAPKEAEPEIRGDKTGLDEAAAELTQTRAERNEVVERTWGDPRDWSKHAPGNYQVSAEHASKMLAETPEAEARLAQAEMALPPDIRQAIARRENDRDRALKTKFQELADLRKRLGSTADESAQTTEKVNGNESSEKI